MPPSDSGPEEAITNDEIHGAEAPPKKPRNAFTELMTSKSKPKPKPAIPSYMLQDRRMGLGVYLVDPTAYPRVISHNPSFVVIHDMFPKATVHTLLLPRSEKHNLLHPFDAFDDPEFLAKTRAEAEKLKVLAAKELRRRIGTHSAAEASREAVLNGDVEAPNGDLPAGRDWEEEIICGVHAVPSMSHLHVHVLSREMHSGCVKHRKHYNSFQTPFLVSLDDFPLKADDPRWNTEKERYLDWDLKCWRCGKTFGNRFQRLKEHLEQEFEEWKKE